MNLSEGAMPTTEGLHTKPQVCKGEGQTAYKCALGYRKLGVDPKNLQRAPFFATQLKNIARAVRGAVRITHAFDLLPGSEDPDARKVSDAYRSVPASYRRLLAPEAFCLAAGVEPNRVLEFVVTAALRRTGQISTIVGALTLPRVVGKTVERALQDDGTRERMMLLKATGFVPSAGVPSFVQQAGAK
jgi:hypothetical protein